MSFSRSLTNPPSHTSRKQANFSSNHASSPAKPKFFPLNPKKSLSKGSGPFSSLNFIEFIGFFD